MPATLAKPNELIRHEHFKTTTGTAHDTKFLGGPYGNIDPQYKKAPGHWKVDYIKDFHEKVCIKDCCNMLILKVLKICKLFIIETSVQFSFITVIYKLFECHVLTYLVMPLSFSLVVSVNR